MQPIERNQTFTNLLVNSASPYLRQHAHNPVYWHPWGREAIELARTENKPIFLSIGYSSCYWCHVMEREVFENLSIASSMNRSFINIKVDREEHPELDDIYMIARQLLKHEGGWPNNLFLTPDLKPFYAGGTYAPDESPGRPSFPRLLEWVNYVWVSQQDEVQRISGQLTRDMQQYLVYQIPQNPAATDITKQSEQLFQLMQQHYDGRAGGFFQAPKFPHECYLEFLLGYYESTGKIAALDMVTNTLGKMAAGGIYDHVGCGFHRYAIDKEWYVPHFEKMLYNQAQLARLYTDAARITGNAYFADIAKSIFDFVGGPMTAANGGFYSAIDAETDGVEGAHYAWSSEEFEKILTKNEIAFLTKFYALADIPQFPGHKHVDGQVLIARKPLDIAARENNMPYAQLAAMSAELMNKLLAARGKRRAPILDDKILVGWNGLMIDAFAHAGRVFNRPSYTARAREAADFLLENAIDNDGNLKRVYAGGNHYLEATLDDYVFLTKGLISLWRVTPDATLLDSAKAFVSRIEELFGDKGNGYFYTQASDDLLFRIKSGDDSAIPGASGVLLHNLLDLYEITKESIYLDRAKSLAAFFLNGNNNVSIEFATMMQAALRLINSSPLEGEVREGGNNRTRNDIFAEGVSIFDSAAMEDTVTVSASLFPDNPAPGAACEVMVTLDIKDGWHINSNQVNQPFLIATQVDVQGEGIELIDIIYPEPLRRPAAEENQIMLQYEGLITISARLKISRDKKRQPIKIMVRYQPCHGTSCHAVKDVVVTI